jgi:hypothetical protein
MEYVKRITELETNSRNKNIKDLHTVINEYKGRYQPRINLIKDKNGDLLANSHNILISLKNYFSAAQYIYIYMALMILGRHKSIQMIH